MGKSENENTAAVTPEPTQVAPDEAANAGAQQETTPEAPQSDNGQSSDGPTPIPGTPLQDNSVAGNPTQPADNA